MDDSVRGARIRKNGSGIAIQWRLRQFVLACWRRMGWTAPAILLAVVVCMVAFLWDNKQRNELLQTQQKAESTAAQDAHLLSATKAAPRDDNRERLQAFLTGLPPHQDIPMVLQDLLTFADRQGLAFAKGEYQLQVDTIGGFSRYHMTVSVRGKGIVVRRFVSAALKAHPYLALDGVQFHRARADAAEVEAKVQWILFTTLPGVHP